jgi:hypothetical protein
MHCRPGSPSVSSTRPGTVPPCSRTCRPGSTASSSPALPWWCGWPAHSWRSGPTASRIRPAWAVRCWASSCWGHHVAAGAGGGGVGHGGGDAGAVGQRRARRCRHVQCAARPGQRGRPGTRTIREMALIRVSHFCSGEADMHVSAWIRRGHGDRGDLRASAADLAECVVPRAALHASLRAPRARGPGSSAR